MNKKQKLLLLALLLLSWHGFTQIIPLGRTDNRIDVIDDHAESFRVTLRYAALQVTHTELREGAFSELSLEGGCYDGAVGYPKLPVTQRLVEIPFGADPQVRVIRYNVEEYDLADFGYPLLHWPLGLVRLSRMRSKVFFARSAYSSLPVASAYWAKAMQAKVLEKIL